MPRQPARAVRPVCEDCPLQPLRSGRVRRTRQDGPASRGRETVPLPPFDVVHLVVVLDRSALGVAMHEVARVSVVELDHGCAHVAATHSLPVALLTVMQQPSRPLGRRPCRGPRARHACRPARSHRHAGGSVHSSAPPQRAVPPTLPTLAPQNALEEVLPHGFSHAQRVVNPHADVTRHRPHRSPRMAPARVRPHLASSPCHSVIATRSTCHRPGHRQLQDMQSSGVALAIRLAAAGKPKVFTASLPAQARNPIAALPTTPSVTSDCSPFSCTTPAPRHPICRGD